MENVTSPVPANASARSIERNVLKELNNIEGATKSPKEPKLADQPEIHQKDNRSPVIVTSNCVANGGTGGSKRIGQSSSEESEKIMQLGENPQDATFVSTESQDATFVATNTVNNETVVMVSESSDLPDKKEAKEYSAFDQTQTLSEFQPNQCLSTDSLDLDGGAQNFSMHSPSLKPDEPTTPTDKRLPAVSAEKLFSSRKAPTFSEMFSSASPTTIESNNSPANRHAWDASFLVEKTDAMSDEAPNKESINATVVIPDNNDTVPVMASQKGGVDNFMVLNSNDFDFLQSRGANSVNPEDDPRSSLLLRFDPLVKGRCLHPAQSKPSVRAIEEVDTTSTLSGATNEQPSNGFLVDVADAMESDGNSCMNNVRIETNGDKIIAVDELVLTNKKIDVTSVDENIRKKMEEFEATQEILLKRITEKDKAITKASNVLELYEKAIAEALAAKEKLSQNYDKEHEELKSDRDVNFQHLLSLESTFADLHMKFERNVQYTGQLHEKLNAITEDKSKAEDLLRQQEFRYDKMKSHTMQQFDIANAKLEQQTRTISLDNTKLRAQIKREEIHKNAVAEELSQKKKENEELVKICDELISGQRN